MQALAPPLGRARWQPLLHVSTRLVVPRQGKV